MKNILIIGSGQSGTRIATRFFMQYDVPKDRVICFNTSNDDNTIKDQIIIGEDGSGRNPMFTLEHIIPKKEKLIENNIKSRINEVDTIILLNSAGGGSGSAINYYIAENILSKEEYANIKVFLFPIFGFKHEGNPVNSNGIAMMNLYTRIYNKVTILPIQNDTVYKEGEKSTFDVTNDYICRNIYKIIDYDYFVGYQKQDGIGTLDKNEHRRITSPLSGFMSYASAPIDKPIPESSPLNDFNLSTATNIVVMFRTKKHGKVTMNTVKQIEAKYPNAIKIFAESLADKEEIVEYIFNGIELSTNFEEAANDAITKIENTKTQRKQTKTKNKSISKVGKKSLFNI